MTCKRLLCIQIFIIIIFIVILGCFYNVPFYKNDSDRYQVKSAADCLLKCGVFVYFTLEVLILLWCAYCIFMPSNFVLIYFESRPRKYQTSLINMPAGYILPYIWFTWSVSDSCEAFALSHDIVRVWFCSIITVIIKVYGLHAITINGEIITNRRARFSKYKM